MEERDAGRPIMSFPEREWEMLKEELKTKGSSSSTRCCKELDKYKAGDVYETPWGDLVRIKKVTRYTRLEDIPTWKYFDKGMKISARVGARYGGNKWDHVIFEKVEGEESAG